VIVINLLFGVILEELLVTQPFKKLPASNGMGRPITNFTGAFHWSPLSATYFWQLMLCKFLTVHPTDVGRDLV
jgi:hypothetical protein